MSIIYKMYQGEEFEYPWSQPDYLGYQEDATTSDTAGHSDNDSQQKEDSIDQAEMEAMLYSQIYFEQNQDTEQPDIEYDVIVEEEPAKPADISHMNSSFASMVNFSGRSYMSPAVSVTKKDRINKDGDDEDDKWRKATTTKAKSALKKLLAKITGTAVVDDEAVQTKQSKKSRKKKNEAVQLSDSSNGEGKTNRKRKKEKNTSAIKEKVKKSEQVFLDSSTDVHHISDSESDSDLIMLDQCDPDVDDLDLETNIEGIWATFRDPERSENPDLNTIDISKWDGSPALTIQEVKSLLRACGWKLNDDDRYGLQRSYGNSRRLDCRNCRQIGHLAVNCPKPKKVTCILCGGPHFFRRCKNTLCYNCDLPGHDSKLCDAPRRSRHVTCNRCGYKGHITSTCPELWREYHLTTNPGRLVLREQEENKAAFCYNCGERGHFGYDCSEERINYYCQPMAPFTTMTHAQRHQYERDSGISRLSHPIKKKDNPNKKPKKKRDKYKELMGSSTSLSFEPKNNSRNSKKKRQLTKNEVVLVNHDVKVPYSSRSSKQCTQKAKKAKKAQKIEKTQSIVGSIFDTEEKSSIEKKTGKERKRNRSRKSKSNKALIKQSSVPQEKVSVASTIFDDIKKSVRKKSKKEKKKAVEGSGSGRNVKFTGTSRGFRMTTGIAN